jgi:transcription elongation factor GreB
VTVTIVGIDETDLARGHISWVSPVARALLGARVGDLVRVRAPQGIEAVEVVAIRYPEG